MNSIFLKSSFIVLLFIANAFAQEFVIEGNTKTKTEYIRELANNCQANANANLQQCLLNSKLFSAVEITQSDKYTTISVKDRISIIPIPMVKSDRYSSSYGVMLLESNLLGRGDKAIVSARTGSLGSSFFMATDFNKVPLLTNFSGGPFLAHIIESKSQEAIGDFEQQKSVVAFELGSKELRFGSSFTHYEFDSIFENDNRFGVSVRYTLDKTDFRWYFNQGIILNSALIYQLPSEKQSGGAVSTIGTYERSVFAHHALQFRAAGYYSFDLMPYELFSVDANRGFRGVEEGSLWINKFGSLSFDYQIPLKEFSAFTWTVAPFIDYSLFQSYQNSEWEKYYSYGMGTYMFIKTVALPGMGLLLGKNSVDDEIFFKFFIGMKI